MFAPHGANQPVTDAHRQQVADRLRVALDQGRLDFTEYDERLQRATGTQSIYELNGLVADLGDAPVASGPVTGVPASPGPWQSGYAPVVGYPPPPNPDVDQYGRVLSDKSKIVAGVLQLTVGYFGVGRFYMGDVGLGLAQLFTCGGCGIWALIDGIMLLVGDPTDKDGRPLRS